MIVTSGGPSAAAAKQATSAIPIIVANAGDVVETGLVSSLARPGGNISGVNDPAAVKRVAVLWNASDNAMTLRYRQIEKAADVLRMSI